MQRLIDQHPLQRGAHPTRAFGMCAMEMVAWLAGEPHSDEPRCACPVVAAFVRAANDAMDDAARNRHLRPIVPLLVNTRGDAELERVRGFLVVDALVRRLLPARLRRQRRGDVASLLADLPPVRSRSDARAALAVLEHFAADQHAAIWVLQRAAEGMAPSRFVAGAIQVAKAGRDADTWTAVAGLVRELAATRLCADAPSSLAPVRTEDL